MTSRLKAIPVSVYPLLLLLLAAAIWLQRSPPETVDRRVFRTDADRVDSLRVRISDGGDELEMRLTGGPDRWRLQGRVNDLVDQGAVRGLLRSLCAEEASPPLDVGSWRRRPEPYGLAEPRIRVDLYHDHGATVLSIGLENPSTTLSYAAYEQDDGLYQITPKLVESLAGLMGSVRAEKLWPDFSQDDVDTFAITPAGRKTCDVFVRDNGGRWWLLPPDDGLERFDDLSRFYQSQYDDRFDATRGAFRIRDAEVSEFMSLLRTSAVKRFLPIGAAVRPADADGAAYRVRVASSLEDFAYDVQIDARATDEGFLVWRNDCREGMIIADVAVNYLDYRLADFLQRSAITETVAWADSLLLSKAGYEDIRAHRIGTAWRLVGAHAQPEGSHLDDVLKDFTANLDKLPMSHIRPHGSPEADRINADTITRLRVWRHGYGLPREEEIVFGLLLGSGEAVAWFPGAERLVGVDPSILIFCREYYRMVTGPPKRVD